MYAITTVGGELVPVPDGVEAVSLTVGSPPAAWSPLWVYVTGEKYPPFKAASQLSTGQTTTYDQAIITTNTLLHYWPLNDPTGTQLCADLGPGPAIPLGALPGVTLGASGILPDGATCAQSNGNAGAGITSASLQIVNEVKSLEFWFAISNANCCLMAVSDVEHGGGFDLDISAAQSLTMTLSFTAFDTHVLVPANTPNHLVATSNAGVFDLYLNGALVLTLSSSSFAQTGQPSWLYNINSGTQQAAGKIEKIALYSGVLSLAQVRAHFAAGA
jgi:hypothetical protein